MSWAELVEQGRQTRIRREAEIARRRAARIRGVLGITGLDAVIHEYVTPAAPASSTPADIAAAIRAAAEAGGDLEITIEETTV